MERKLEIFATFAVVLLIGALFVPAAQSSEIEIELSEEEKRKIQAAQEIELKNGELYLPENKSEEIGMSKEEKDDFDSILQEINLWAEEGYFEFEIEIVNETEEIIVNTTDELDVIQQGEDSFPQSNITLTPIEERPTGGSNWYKIYTGWTGVYHEFGLNHFWTQWLASYPGIITVGLISVVLSIATSGAAAAVIIGAAIIILEVGINTAANIDEGDGVIWTFKQYWGTPPSWLVFESLEPQ
ncbi:MAG: hypothetical protein ACOC6U_02640 [Thermoplasmatota archaeon]